MGDQQVLEPHQQAMSDVDQLARVMYEINESGGWDRAPWVDRGYWRGMAVKVLSAGYRPPAAQHRPLNARSASAVGIPLDA